jgi:hypothetical protein
MKTEEETGKYRTVCTNVTCTFVPLEILIPYYDILLRTSFETKTLLIQHCVGCLEKIGNIHDSRMCASKNERLMEQKVRRIKKIFLLKNYFHFYFCSY